MNLAVIVAFTAAAISLINIIVTARLTSGSQFRQWQREEARPITARILTLSGEARRAWASAVAAHTEWLGLRDDKQRALELQERADEYLAAGRATLGKLSFEEAQLNLIAAPPTREAAAALVGGHVRAELALSGYPSHEDLSGVIQGLNDMLAQQQTLIDKFVLTWACPPTGTGYAVCARSSPSPSDPSAWSSRLPIG